MTSQNDHLPTFESMGLSEAVMQAVTTAGYETPSEIQARTIPHILAGRDLIGQAQTGTGKTAAFAMPLLSRLDPAQKTPQVLVLAPTRELAQQVAESFRTYGARVPGLTVSSIYGGAGYREQIQELRRGAQIVVGTPGRVMDHMRKGTLKLDELRCLVLDEADEMLRMGFIDDVEWVLERTPAQRQVALFSATMPEAIRRIARVHLRDPEEAKIKVKTTTAETIRQRCWMVSGTHKLDALSRILEAETFDGVIVFARTKVATEELAEKLVARGYAAAALNGDVAQAQRERTVESLKKGRVDILVATDVAARGLDVERISHVINYDAPHDTESYVHRIGRTGRAGRTGEAIIFVAPREKRMLFAIERATRQKIEMMALPSAAAINEKRVARFKKSIMDMLDDSEELARYRELIEQLQNDRDIPAVDLAAALARMARGASPLWLKEVKQAPAPKDDGGRPKPVRKARGAKQGAMPDAGMRRYKIQVGHDHGVKPGNIVGAIANEAGLDSQNIGRVNIFAGFSTVDLPDGMPVEIFRTLQKTRVRGRPLSITPDGEGSAAVTRRPRKSNSRASSRAG